MKDQTCGYRMGGEILDQLGLFICDLSVSQNVPDESSENVFI